MFCVIDPTTDQHPALQRAAWIARNAGAKLELFVCYYNEYLSGNGLLDAPSLKRARAELTHGYKRILESMARPLRRKGIVVKTTVVWDHPLYEGVIRQAVRSRTDIVFKDMQHDTAAARASFSNTDWNLIRTCPVPLWLVKRRAVEHPVIFVAAIDPLNRYDKPAALDDQILRLSKSIAENVNGEVHAFHSYDTKFALATAIANAYVPNSLPFREVEEHIREQHKKRFTEITQFHEIETENTHLVSGLAHEEMPVYAASLKAVVVVMGAIARNLWQRLFIGATAEQTLEHLPCDSLVVKPDWFQPPVNLELDTGTSVRVRPVIGTAPVTS